MGTSEQAKGESGVHRQNGLVLLGREVIMKTFIKEAVLKLSIARRIGSRRAG